MEGLQEEVRMETAKETCMSIRASVAIPVGSNCFFLGERATKTTSGDTNSPGAAAPTCCQTSWNATKESPGLPSSTAPIDSYGPPSNYHRIRKSLSRDTDTGAHIRPGSLLLHLIWEPALCCSDVPVEDKHYVHKHIYFLEEKQQFYVICFARSTREC